MQVHGQEEMFTGHHQVGWSSNPGKGWLKNNFTCQQVLTKIDMQPAKSLTRNCTLLTQ